MESRKAVVQRALAPHNMSDELYRAAESGDWGAIQRSPEYKKSKTANGNNILHVLAQARNSSANAVQQILAERPRLAFEKNGNGETPLVIASRRGHLDVVRQLIVATHDGNDMRLAAVLEAVRFNRSHVVGLFLEQLPELFEQEPHVEPGRLALSIAALKGLILLFMKRKKKESPLYLAIEKGHHDIVDMIMSSSCTSIACHGPDDNLTAPHAAAIRNSPEWCIKVMSDKIPHLTNLMGVDGWTPLHYAAKLDHNKIVKLLLSLNKSMGYAVVRNDECKTALHIAVINGHLDVIREIIYQCPQSWEMVTDKRHNILHLAIENEHEKVLEWMLGCSWASELINKQDVDGNTPLHLYVSTQNLVGRNNLVNHPCVDMNPLNKTGLTPLDMVTSQTCNYTAVQISVRDELIKAGATASLWRINIESETVSRGDDDGPENARIHMVVATLILAVAFGAGFTVSVGYNNTKENLGMPVLGKKAAFIVFVVSDSFAVLLSIAAVQMQLLVKDKGLKKRQALLSQKFSMLRNIIPPQIPIDKDVSGSKVFIACAMASLAVAFISGMYAFIPVGAVKIYLLSIGSLFCFHLVLYALYVVVEDQVRAFKTVTPY